MAGTDLTAKVGVVAETKPGFKSTEFWKSIAVHVVAVAIIAYGMHKGSDGLVQFGTILMGITQGTYNLSRAIAKGGAAKTVAALVAAGDKK